MAAQNHSPPLFLCGHRKSGTSMLLNLFDGHPALAAYPVDLALLYAYFPDYLAKHPDPAARRARLDRILFAETGAHLRKYEAADAVDLEAVRARFFDGLEDDALGAPGALLARLFAAFQAVKGPEANRAAALVAKETSIEIYAAEILDWFPEARFIQVIRDPRDIFAALAAGVERHYAKLGEGHEETLASLLHRARLGLRFGRLNAERYGPERYRTVRFEDLVAAPEDTMRALAAFAGIDFDPCLMCPTILGRPTPGNNYDGTAMFEISAANAGRWRDRIPERDAQVIEFHLAEEMAAFGYDPAFAPEEQAAAAADFYKWQNYRYFYSDRFA
jgi:hypothetical protein